MNPSFLRLNREKQDRVLDAALVEFAGEGFDGASTNRIVERAGISKGSLFKYFSSKDDLYVYLAGITLEKIVPIMKARISELPGEISERIRLTAEAVIDIYIENPLYYHFFMGMLDSGAREVQARILRHNMEAFSFLDLFGGVDQTGFRIPPESVFTLITWLFTGIKQEIFEMTKAKTDPQLLKSEFMKRMPPVLDALKFGIYRQTS